MMKFLDRHNLDRVNDSGERLQKMKMINRALTSVVSDARRNKMKKKDQLTHMQQKMGDGRRTPGRGSSLPWERDEKTV